MSVESWKSCIVPVCAWRLMASKLLIILVILQSCKGKQRWKKEAAVNNRWHCRVFSHNETKRTLRYVTQQRYGSSRFWSEKKITLVIYTGLLLTLFMSLVLLVIRSWSDAHQKLIRCVLIFYYQILLSKLLVWCQMPSDSQISDAIWSTSDDQRTRPNVYFFTIYWNPSSKYIVITCINTLSCSGLSDMYRWWG